MTSRMVILGALEALEAPLGGSEALPWLGFSSRHDTAPDHPDPNVHLSHSTAGPADVERLLCEQREGVQPFAGCGRPSVLPHPARCLLGAWLLPPSLGLWTSG